MTVKFFVRRLIVAPLVVLSVASAYFVLVLWLVAIGCEPTATAVDTWFTGLSIGVGVAVLFLFTNYKRVS